MALALDERAYDVSRERWNTRSRCYPCATRGAVWNGSGFFKSLILLVPLPRLERGTPRSTIWGKLFPVIFPVFPYCEKTTLS
jgi:hypothetical protein